jgi:hypothetical protein
MKKLGLAVAILGLLVGATSLPAKASTYDVTFTGSVFDVFANINVDSGNNVTSMSGTVVGVNGAPISMSLVPLNTQPAWIYDNKFNAAGNPYFSNPGILFTAGTWIYNLYSATIGSSVVYYLSTYNPDGVNYNPGDLGTLRVSQTPIPAPFLLLGSVLAAGGLILRRRRQNNSSTALTGSFAA